jgi:hypothetical protein
MFASPENVRKVLSSSRKRLDASSFAIRDLRQSFLVTSHLVWRTWQLIARSDSLIEQIDRVYTRQS